MARRGSPVGTVRTSRRGRDPGGCYGAEDAWKGTETKRVRGNSERGSHAGPALAPPVPWSRKSCCAPPSRTTTKISPMSIVVATGALSSVSMVCRPDICRRGAPFLKSDLVNDRNYSRIYAPDRELHPYVFDSHPENDAPLQDQPAHLKVRLRKNYQEGFRGPTLALFDNRPVIA